VAGLQRNFGRDRSGPSTDACHAGLNGDIAAARHLPAGASTHQSCATS